MQVCRRGFLCSVRGPIDTGRVSDDSKQQGSSLSEKLKLSGQENAAMRAELEELRKRLEMADLMLQQYSSQSDPSTANQQVQMLLEEKQHLEAHTHQLLESIAQLQTERDRYAQQIQEEGRIWKDKTEQLLTQVKLVAEERDSNISRLRDNGQLSRLCVEKESRLGELERQAEGQTQRDTCSRPQQTNENMELTSAIQSEQHVKKEVARKLGQLQEDLHNMKEQSLQEQRDQTVAHLQQYCAGYQTLASEREQLHHQYLQQAQLMDRLQHDESQGRAQLELSHQQLKHAQDRLDLLVRDNLQLKTEVQDLLASSVLNSSPRDQGDGVESMSVQESPQAPQPIDIPEDFESHKEMEEFIRGLVSRLEAERDEARGHLEDERRLHLAARHQAAAALAVEHQQHHGHHDHDHDHDHHRDDEHGHGHGHSHEPHGQCEHSSEHTGGAGGVPAEVHEALRGAMEKLQYRFTSLMQEKADLRERVEELEHRCIQLSGETDTIDLLTTRAQGATSWLLGDVCLRSQASTSPCTRASGPS
ncbi:hypothetical protein CRUP_003732 [Coryphaenoides rupestris]|nr:hypothetical protein CRUP_003732 [Coryphaenoides rupestris]